MSGDLPRIPRNEQSSGKVSIHSESSKQNIKRPKSPTKPKPKIEEFDADGVFLAEDHYAEYYDELGNQHEIKRFTWKNKNKIQIEVINFGARVISIKLPDRTGDVEDVLLGFDELAGYLHYSKQYFGSIIGRVSSIIKNSCFVIGDKKFNVSANFGGHSVCGGVKGLDKTVWDTYISNKKVIMSHISPHQSDGYPGDLLIRAIFELSAKNEFKILFEAETTQPTCIDLSQLLFFNLAGHHRGPDEIYRHILTLNCNCFTPQIDKIPTGEILNVIHTQFDFQVPKVLGKVIGVVPKDGFDQYLCVNRGMYQEQCFVGRLLHPPSGRMIEIYSNQPGVRLYTANDFGYGNLMTIEDILQKEDKTKSIDQSPDNTMLLFQKIHEKVLALLKIDELQNFTEIKSLINKFVEFKSKNITTELTEEDHLKLTRHQFNYLQTAKEIACENEETDQPCLDLKEVLSEIIKIVEVIEPEIQSAESKEYTRASNVSNAANSSKQSITASKEKIDKSSDKNFSKSKLSIGSLSKMEQSKQPKSRVLDASIEKHQNIIPIYYKNSDHIVGKGRAVYKSHGAIALQTENYPNAVNFKHFPNTTLNPGEVYRHEITYRFWIRAGNPNKWIKRNLKGM